MVAAAVPATSSGHGLRPLSLRNSEDKHDVPQRLPAPQIRVARPTGSCILRNAWDPILRLDVESCARSRRKRASTGRRNSTERRWPRLLAMDLAVTQITVLSNNALQLTRREGAAASRPVVEARLAAERGC